MKKINIAILITGNYFFAFNDECQIRTMFVSNSVKPLFVIANDSYDNMLKKIPDEIKKWNESNKNNDMYIDSYHLIQNMVGYIGKDYYLDANSGYIV